MAVTAGAPKIPHPAVATTIKLINNNFNKISDSSYYAFSQIIVKINDIQSITQTPNGESDYSKRNHLIKR